MREFQQSANCISRVLLKACCLAGATLSIGTAASSQVAPSDARSRCEALARPGALPGFDAITARFIAAAPLTPAEARRVSSPAIRAAPLPAHCRIDAAIERRRGNKGKPYEIKLELRVPAEWNGRLVFQGGGAFKGVVDPALGLPVTGGSSAPLPLARGYAVVTSDSGHTGLDAAFTEDQLATLNYAYASVGKVARAAKAVLTAYSGRPPERTYFEGCSNGGREALLAAQRFPEEFDGVVAGNPAHLFGRDAALRLYSTQTFGRLAPRASDGLAQPWLAFTAADWKVVQTGILAQCDAADGLADGLIFNHATCQFRPERLTCRKGQTDSCLAPVKVGALADAFRGPVDAKGQQLLHPWAFDGSIGMPSWLVLQTGFLDPKGNLVAPEGRTLSLPNAVLTQLYRYPPVSQTQAVAESWEQMLSRMADREGMVNSASTQLSSFVARGGKLLMVHGWSDPALSPVGFVRWYEQLQRDVRNAGDGSADDFARLFMVPGMTHCGGGNAIDDFDALTALTQWVEHGEAPARLIAAGSAFPGVHRPLCAYPKFARYRGAGDRNAASSFTCE